MLTPGFWKRCRDASVSSSIADCVRYSSRVNSSREVVSGGTTVEPGKASASSGLRQRILRSASRNALRIGVSLLVMMGTSELVLASAAGTIVDMG